MTTSWLLVGVGVAVLLWAVIGRRTGSARHCAKCAFELTGLPNDADRCPECGRALKWQIGKRERRPRLAVAATLVALIGIAGVATSTPGLGRRIAARLPSPVLVFMAERESEVALRELSQRLAIGTLSPDSARDLADGSLDRQAGDRAVFMPLWAEVLEQVRMAGLLTPDQYAAYVQQSIAIDVYTRPTLRAEPEMGVWIRPLDPNVHRNAGHDTPAYEVAFKEVRVGEARFVSDSDRRVRWSLFPSQGGRVHTKVGLDRSPAPGATVCTLVLSLRAARDRAAMEAGELISEWEVTRAQDVEVKAGGQPVVALLDSPDVHEQLLGSAQASAIEVLDGAPGARWEPTVSFAVFRDRGGYAMAFRAVAIFPDGRHVDCGRAVARADDLSIDFVRRARDPGQLAASDWPASVDIVLTPAVDEVYWHYNDIDSVLNTELVFRGVEVRKTNEVIFPTERIKNGVRPAR